MKKGLFTLLAIFAITFQTTAQEITIEPVQMTLLTKKTATWCPPCGGWAWTTFENLLSDHSEKAVVMAAQFSTVNDSLYNMTAENLIASFENFPGRPVFYTNSVFIQPSGSAQVEAEIAAFVEEAYTQTPVAQSGIAATVDFTTNILTVSTKTEFFQEGNGEYYLSTYLMDKEAVANQSGQGSNALHKNVLRDELTLTTFGSVLAEGTLAVGSTFEQSYEIDVAADIDINNMSFVTVLWKKNGETYDFVNTFKTDKVTEAIPSAVERIFEAGEFNISPTITTEQTVVELVLNENINQMNISLFDIKGQKLQTIFQGKQVLGTHRFEVEKASLPAGIYLVRLTVNGEFFSKRVIFK